MNARILWQNIRIIVLMQRLQFLFFALFLVCCKQATQIHPQRRNIVEAVYASGKIMARNEYTLYALSSGTVVKKLATDGDLVDKNQVLYVIDHDASAARLDAAQSSFDNAKSNLSSSSRVLSDYRLQMENAEAKYKNDSLELMRLNNLIKENIGTQSAVDHAMTNAQISLNQKKAAEEKYFAMKNDLEVGLQNARSMVAGAKSELGNYFIRSQANGILFQALKEQGEAVRANEPVAVLGDKDERLIRLFVDQQDINRLKPGQEVLLKTDVTANNIFKARVSRIYPLMNEVDQTFRVDATFEDSTQYPFIHSSVEANIIIQRKNSVLVIPRNTLVSEDHVTILENGKQRSIQVRLGIQTLDEAEVLDGLSENSTIVIPIQK